MYFSQFPKIYYDFPQDATSSTLQILTDITQNVRVRKQVLENITLYDEYDMLEGETPEIVAEKFYGNPEYHWIIMLVNQRYNYLQDFPMTSYELDQYISDTYGDGIYQVHHYEKDGVVTPARATLKLTDRALEELKVHDIVLSLPYVTGRVESIDTLSKTANVLLDKGRFSDGDLVVIDGLREDPTSGELIYTGVINFNLPSNGFELIDVYNAITNYEYEVRENENKRRIKLISPTLVSQVVKEFRSLIATA